MRQVERWPDDSRLSEQSPIEPPAESTGMVSATLTALGKRVGRVSSSHRLPDRLLSPPIPGLDQLGIFLPSQSCRGPLPIAAARPPTFFQSSRIDALQIGDRKQSTCASQTADYCTSRPLPLRSLVFSSFPNPTFGYTRFPDLFQRARSAIRIDIFLPPAQWGGNR